MALSTFSSHGIYGQQPAAPCAPRAHRETCSDADAEIDECIVVAAGELRHVQLLLQAHLERERATVPNDNRRLADISTRLNRVTTALRALQPEPPADC